MTRDTKIFDKDTAIIQIIKSIVNKDAVIQIDLVGEGPCCNSIGIYTMLDEICDAFKYPKQNIEIHTANFLEEHAEYCIIRQHQNYELSATLNTHKKSPNFRKEFDDKFMHFGHFINHGNKARLHLASYLRSNHSDQTLQSYNCDVTNEHYRAFVSFENLMFDRSITREQIKWAFDLLMQSPLKLENSVPSCPIAIDETFNITGYYSGFFVELVSLTFSGGNTFYIDEKIWRPVLMRTPFMVQGPRGLITNLRRLGFRTFDTYWNEGYSEDPDGCHVPAMIENIKKLSKLSIQELESMYNDMSTILDHNLHRLLELKSEDFIKTFGQ